MPGEGCGCGGAVRDEVRGVDERCEAGVTGYIESIGRAGLINSDAIALDGHALAERCCAGSCSEKGER